MLKYNVIFIILILVSCEVDNEIGNSHGTIEVVNEGDTTLNENYEGKENENYDKAAVYILDSSKCLGSKLPIVYKGSITNCFTEYTELNNNQINEVMTILEDTSTYGGAPLSCSTKELGLVFYNKGQIVNFISISFECSNIESSYPIPANEKYKIDSGTEGKFIYSSFSNYGKRKLFSYFTGLGLPIDTDFRE